MPCSTLWSRGTTLLELIVGLALLALILAIAAPPFLVPAPESASAPRAALSRRQFLTDTAGASSMAVIAVAFPSWVPKVVLAEMR
jgi:prepilin-type N-terminal cleavage/methylation domain-containing protein